jgi:glycosyltransferase
MITDASQFFQVPPQARTDPEDEPSRDPSFTIITACRNNAATIEECVQSVARQTLRNVEHVVVDSHSQDDSIERIYASRERLSIVYGSSSDNRFQAWNRGIGQATGDVVGFVNADEVLANPDVLKQVAEAFEHPWTSAVYGDILCVDARNACHVVRQNRLGPATAQKLARGWVPPTSSLFVRKSWYRRIDGFSPGMRTTADYAATLRLFSYPFFNAVYLGEPVIRQRITPPSFRQLRRALIAPREELKALRAAQVGGWHSLVWNRLTRIEQWL